MNWIARATAVAGTALLLSLSAASSASAAVASQGDPRGDAPRRFDATRVVANNNEQVLTVKAKVANLTSKPTSFDVFLTPANTQDEAYWARSVRKRNGKVRTTLQYADHTSGWSEVPCDITARWRSGKDVVKIVAEQACFSVQRTMKVDAALGKPNDPHPYDVVDRFRVAFN